MKRKLISPFNEYWGDDDNDVSMMFIERIAHASSHTQKWHSTQAIKIEIILQRSLFSCFLSFTLMPMCVCYSTFNDSLNKSFRVVFFYDNS